MSKLVEWNGGFRGDRWLWFSLGMSMIYVKYHIFYVYMTSILYIFLIYLLYSVQYQYMYIYIYMYAP